MKRCPDCGFRVEETYCPLCGVRMQQVGASVPAHTHTQQGERCMLPNKEQRAPTKQTDTAPKTYQPQRDTGRSRGKGSPVGALGVIGAVILISLLRACVGAL